MSTGENKPLIVNKEELKLNKIKCKHFILLPTFVFLVFGYSVQYYVICQWIQQVIKREVSPDATGSTSGCNLSNTSDPRYKAFQTVEKKTALWQLYFLLPSSISAFFVTAILPSYSDTFGRRILFVIPCSMMLLKAIFCTLIIYYELDLIWLIVAAFLEGIGGSYLSVLSGGYSFIADITNPGRQRTILISCLDGVQLLTITLGAFVAGYFIEFQGYFVPMLACASITLCAWVLAVLLLPETLHAENQSNVISVFTNLKRTVEFYKSKTFVGKRVAYTLLLLSIFAAEIAGSNRAQIELLYQLGKPFCWPAQKIGLFSAARHATQGFAGVALITPLNKCLSEISIAILSNFVNAGSFVLEAFARTDLVLYLVPVPALLGRLTVSMAKSIMSSMTDADKQGSLFASITVVTSVCGFTAPFLNNAVYAATVSLFNGFIFLVLAGFCGISFTLLLIYTKTETSKIATPRFKTVIHSA